MDLVDVAIDAARADGVDGLVQRLAGLDELANPHQGEHEDAEGHGDSEEHPEEARGAEARTSAEPTKNAHASTPCPPRGRPIGPELPR